jgi:ABC-type Fe3+/spermidine/putrescine transport system ATPase subunit
VVLFDEPLSNVDALVRAQLRFELKRMQARLGFSGLYVTHDQTEAMELGHRVAVLRSGRIAALGSPKEVYRNPPSEYVATFIGATNIWEGTVNGASERGIRVATTLGVIEARPPRSLPATGADVKLAARPEALRLAATRPEGAPNTVEVTVDETLFSGPHTEVVVTRGPVRVRVWVQGDEDIANSPRGRPLWLTMPVEDVSVFPASEA